MLMYLQKAYKQRCLADKGYDLLDEQSDHLPWIMCFNLQSAWSMSNRLVSIVNHFISGIIKHRVGIDSPGADSDSTR